MPAAGADALLSDRPSDLLVVRTADCLPILVVALGGGQEAAGPRAVAAIHAGWRGLVSGVIEAALSKSSGQLPARGSSPPSVRQ